ncbi:Methionine-R-sulfoxide reductase B1-A [Chamberlinius hualienensis]
MSFCTWEKEEHYKDHFSPGKYVCSNCEYELFSSRTKFEHHSPWPAFTQTVHEDSVSKVPETDRPNAYKVSCGKCGHGLGHEFLFDGPDKISSRF